VVNVKVIRVIGSESTPGKVSDCVTGNNNVWREFWSKKESVDVLT
jgi:hypothetical protein